MLVDSNSETTVAVCLSLTAILLLALNLALPVGKVNRKSHLQTKLLVDDNHTIVINLPKNIKTVLHAPLQTDP
jgi:hypothetical protein